MSALDALARAHASLEGLALGDAFGDRLFFDNYTFQRDVRSRGGVPPVRYEAIREGLQAVAVFAREHRASVHMPRIGAGLAGGSWETISVIVEEELAGQGVEVTVYDLPA